MWRPIGKFFYAYYGNTAVDLDPLPVSYALLTVVEPVLFEWDVFDMAAPIKSSAKCEVRSVIGFLEAKGERPAEIHKLLLLMVTLWFPLVSSPKETLRWEKFDDDDEVQEEVQTAGGRLLWLGDTEVGSKT